jgi:hypothetical protein
LHSRSTTKARLLTVPEKNIIITYDKEHDELVFLGGDMFRFARESNAEIAKDKADSIKSAVKITNGKAYSYDDTQSVVTQIGNNPKTTLHY